MPGTYFALLAAVALQSAVPSKPAEESFRQAESLQSREPLRARMLYEQSARSGYAPAQATLGILLFKEGNRTGALRWLKTAADAGEPRALLIYGTAQFNGDGVPPDRVEGYELVRRAAAQGLPDAKATQSEMELVMPETEKSAAQKLADAAAKKVSAPEQIATSEPVPAVAAKPKAAEPDRKLAAALKTPAAKPKEKEPAARILPAAATRPVTSTGPWKIQLGAFRQPGAGQALYGRLAPSFPGKQPVYVPAGSLTRLLIGPYASLGDASAACRALGPRQACLPVRAP